MPTNANAYNSRLTDEALEKRFRDTFRSQGGAELVDDLYASGVIVPVVDFTQAAEGSQLPQNLQTAWDFSTGFTTISNASSAIITTAGFWQVDLTVTSFTNNNSFKLAISDGITSKTVWQIITPASGASDHAFATDDKFTVFLRSNDNLVATSSDPSIRGSVWYRQIATLSGDLVNPTGFTSS